MFRNKTIAEIIEELKNDGFEFEVMETKEGKKIIDVYGVCTILETEKRIIITYEV